MNYWLAGWRACARERVSHRITRDAYDNLVRSHRAALAELERERARAANAAMRLTDPCPMCDEFERERDNAILDLDTMRGDLEHANETNATLEQLLFAGTRADGEAL